MQRRTVRFLPTLLLVCLVQAVPATAQTDRAILAGTLTDQQGAAVAGAKIRVTAVETGLVYDNSSNDFGYYRFPGLAVGKYTVLFSRDGFTTKKIEDVVLQVGETRTLDASLSLGSIEQIVVVKAEAAPYERSTAESAIVIRSDQIEDLPVNGRDWSTLTILAPWAQDDGRGDQRTIRFAGRARDDNNFQFDGVDATGIQEQAQKSTTRLQISEDAIAEYRVNTALYDAEYGSQAGGQVNVVTKSGTNEFHGSVFGFLRNSAFDAREFVDPQQIPVFRLGQYGFTFGGPIKRDKAFFFLNYEGLRQAQPGTVAATVPDPGLQQAILTASPVMCGILQAWPWRQSAVAQNQALGCAGVHVFPDSFFNNVGTAFNPGDPNNTGFDSFTHGPDTIVHEDTWLARLDYKFTDRTLLYARAQRDVSTTRAPLGNAIDEQGVFNRPANYLVALEHQFTPAIFNVSKVGVNRSPFHNPQICNFPLAVNSGNFEPLNDCNTDNEVGSTISFLDDLSITRGRHTLKTGIELRRVRLNQGITADNTINFTDNLSLIDNNIDNLFYRSSWSLHYLRHLFILPYFQDEWKVTPNLTLNLGIRWEYYSVANEAHDRTTVFDLQNFQGDCIGSGSANRGVISESPNCPNNPTLFRPNYRNWDPRVGIAWAPSRLHGKSVVRAGFGIYHGAAQNDDQNAALESDNTRQSLTQSVDAPPNSLHFGPGFLQNPPDFGVPATPLLQPRALFRQRRDLYVEQWGLTLQHEFPSNFLLTTSYLGSHGVRLFARNYENLCDQATYQATGKCVRPLDAFPVTVNGVATSFGDVDVKRDDGGSSYNGLLLSLQRRMRNGFSFSTNYTWSHSINDGSVGGGEANAPENANCVPCERGPSVFDIRHNFVSNAVYELPFGSGKPYFSSVSGPAAKLVSGWLISGLGTWHTGHPLTVLADIPTPVVPDANSGPDQRPDVVPGVPLTVHPNAANSYQLINPLAFTMPPQDPASGIMLRYGNEPNGLIRSPHVWQMDFEVMKETRINERLSVQFAVQAFNLFNHTQFADPGKLKLSVDCLQAAPFTCTTQQDTGNSFGQINTFNGFNNNNDNFFNDNVGTGLSRQLQFMLRFKF